MRTRYAQRARTWSHGLLVEPSARVFALSARARLFVLSGSLCALTSCDSTRLDAIIAAQSEPIAEGCQSVTGNIEMGSYRIRAASQADCWKVGAETSIFGMRGYLLEMTNVCALEAEAWRFEVSASVPGAFEIHSTSYVGFGLDVQEASKEDGTNVIIYGSHTLPNQRFFVRERAVGVYELAPAHTATSCVTRNDALAPGSSALQIQDCDDSASAQGWQLLPENCGGAAGN